MLILFCWMTSLDAHSQDLSQYKSGSIWHKSDSLRYRILFPEDYKTGKKYPLILFLHGRGEQGSDNQSQLRHGASLFLADSIRHRFKALVVFPQCPINDYWSNVFITEDSIKKRHFQFRTDGEPTWAMSALMALMDTLEGRFNLDKTQVFAGGLSMGGSGVLELIRRKPRTFAAAFSICGGANPATAKQIRHTPLWIFHGLKDDVMVPELSILLVKKLKKYQPKVRLTLYPEANHNSWDSAFREPDLLPWLFSHRKP